MLIQKRRLERKFVIWSMVYEQASNENNRNLIIEAKVHLKDTLEECIEKKVKLYPIKKQNIIEKALEEFPKKLQKVFSI